MKYLIILNLFVLLLVSACTSGESGPVIEAQDAWARPARVMKMEDQEKSDMDEEHMGGMGVNTAAYMVLVNKGSQGDKLVGAESDAAEVVELHESKMEGDVMKMQQVQFVEVPAKGQAELKPGGLHIMLIGLKMDLNEGDNMKLNLEFEVSGIIPVDAEVRMP